MLDDLPPRDDRCKLLGKNRSHITEISKPTQWKPGQSGNLNGRPVGTRQAFSAGFHRDLAEIWAKHGRETMIKTALGSSFTAP